MKIRWNDSMLEFLGGDPEFLEPSSILMPSGLALIATGGFQETDGCIVLRSSPGVFATRRTREILGDETGIEVALSKIHIEQFLDKPVDFFELSRLGLDFGFLLRKELMTSGIVGPFRVIVSSQRADPALNVGDTCTVRFHRERAGQVWLDDDLERYAGEGIAVLDF